jgi:hypothetical protein
MNCLTPEAISSYVRASMEARQAASEMTVAYARPSLAERFSNHINLRRLLETIRQSLKRVPKVRIYDAG